MAQKFRPKTYGGANGSGNPLEFKDTTIAPVETGSILDDLDDLFGDVTDLEQTMHDEAMANQSEEEAEALAEEAETLNEQDRKQTAGGKKGSDEEDEEDQYNEEGQRIDGKKPKKPRYICYCENPSCMIGFREGAQIRSSKGIKDKDGNDLGDDE